MHIRGGRGWDSKTEILTMNDKARKNNKATAADRIFTHFFLILNLVFSN